MMIRCLQQKKNFMPIHWLFFLCGIHSGMMLGVDVEIERSASSVNEIQKTGKFHYLIWQKNLETTLSKLPNSGSVEDDRIPHSGGFYLETLGGTDFGSPNSALDKYDKAFHDGKPLSSQWERSNHTRSKNDPSASWAGHCNGYAASAQRHLEPKENVTRNGVEFTRQDIKALLAEVYMSAKSVFLGGVRCHSNKLSSSPNSRTDVTKMGECEDINPGSFHIALANWIGIEKHTIIFDMSANNQVWNYPLFSYQSQVRMNVSASDALQYLNLSNSQYIFNPSAVKFAYVVTTISYMNAFQNESLGKRDIKQKTYSYVLELNQDGHIVGGEWTKASRNNHPDFVWVSLEPMLGDGNRNLANPHVDPNEVISLWAESIGEDPNNPPTDIMEPIWQTTWGKFANYEVELDGGSTGAVFIGKSVRLTLKRKKAFQGDMQVTIALNDKVMKTISVKGNNDVVYDLQPFAGLNRLAFIWSKGGVEVDRSFLRFDAMP